MNTLGRRKSMGLTLVECLVALAILSFAVLAVSYAAVTGQQQVDYADDETRAVRLARDLCEEILSKAYTDPGGAPLFGPESGETSRPQFDDVDDFHGFAESPGQLKDFTGAAHPAAEQEFSRSVTVAAGSQPVASLGRTFPGVTVTVQVSKPGGVSCRAVRFIPQP
jgi:MSHA pilin protein MshD